MGWAGESLNGILGIREGNKTDPMEEGFVEVRFTPFEPGERPAAVMAVNIQFVRRMSRRR